MMFIIVAVILSVGMLVTAIFAIYNENLKIAVISAGIVSLLASIVYLLLAAPDVAMTEAAIGSGLSTIIFFYVLKRISRSNNG